MPEAPGASAWARASRSAGVAWAPAHRICAPAQETGPQLVAHPAAARAGTSRNGLRNGSKGSWVLITCFWWSVNTDPAYSAPGSSPVSTGIVPLAHHDHPALRGLG